jgi:DNA-binding transcriptional MerR regulator
MSTHASTLFSAGEAARVLGEPLHRLQHLMRTRRLVPSHRIGGRYIFSEQDVERARQLLARKPSGATTPDFK